MLQSKTDCPYYFQYHFYYNTYAVLYIYIRDKKKCTRMYKHTKQASIAGKPSIAAKSKEKAEQQKQQTKNKEGRGSIFLLTKNLFLEFRVTVRVWVYIARMGANRCEKGFSFMTCQKPQRAPRLSPQAAWELEALQ